MNSVSRKVDSSIASAIGLLMLLTTFVFGDPIYAGTWYYVLTWLGLVGILQIAKAPSFLTTGAALALAASFLFYWVWQASLPQPEGLLGLGHLLSLPGLGISAVIAAIIARRFQMPSWAALATGLLACCSGFAIAQLVVCQSMLCCASLSGRL